MMRLARGFYIWRVRIFATPLGGLCGREVDVPRLAARGTHDAGDRRSALHFTEDR
jgi:hypothetical protein